MKRSNFFFFENWNGKAINSIISVSTGARFPLFSSNINFVLLSNRATWENRELEGCGVYFFSDVFMDVLDVPVAVAVVVS